jgi:hypothetical protein
MFQMVGKMGMRPLRAAFGFWIYNYEDATELNPKAQGGVKYFDSEANAKLCADTMLRAAGTQHIVIALQFAFSGP